MIAEKMGVKSIPEMKEPMSVARHKFIEQLVSLVNGSNLPAFVLRPIFQDVLREISELEKREFEADNAKYQAELQKDNSENAD